MNKYNAKVGLYGVEGYYNQIGVAGISPTGVTTNGTGVGGIGATIRENGVYEPGITIEEAGAEPTIEPEPTPEPEPEPEIVYVPTLEPMVTPGGGLVWTPEGLVEEEAPPEEKGIMPWIRKNPLLAVGVGLGVGYMLTKVKFKKG